MPALGGPGPRRTNARAYAKREKAIAKLPKAAPKRAAVYVAPAAAYKPAPRSGPTPKQLEASRTAARTYGSQAKQIQRESTRQKAAAVDKTGLTRSQRTELRHPPSATQRAKATERGYASQGKQIQTQAAVQQIEHYLGKAPKDRRTAISAIKDKKPEDRTLGEHNIVRIHGQRQGTDTRQRKEIGFVPRIKYGTRAKAGEFNVMPVPERLKKAEAKGLLEKDPKKLQAAGFAPPGALEKAVSSPKYAIKAISNVPKDLKEIAITAPTTTAHMVAEQGGAVKKAVEKGSLKPIIKAETKLAKETIEPYKQLYKDPLKFATERPVTTFLMLRGGPAAGKLAVGRLARAEVKVAGKTIKPQMQTLERPSATLHGTTLRVQQTGKREGPSSVDVVKRVVRGDRKDHEPQITTESKVARPAEVDRRVDEAFDANLQQQQRARASELKRAAEEHPRTQRFAPTKKTKAKRQERRDAIEEKVRLAGEGAKQEGDRRFAREFGSHREVSDKGHVYEPKNAPELGGKIHTSEADANKVAENLRKDPKVTWEPHVMKVEHFEGGDGYAVVPKTVHERYNWHKGVGTSVAPGAVTKRVSIKQFKKSVLPFSPGWLLGQVGEAAYRNLMHGSGVGSYIRAQRVLKQMPKKERDELLARTVQPAQFGATGPTGEFARGRGRTLAEEYQATPGAKPYVEALTKVGATPGIRHLRAAHRRYSSVLFNDINGTIERLSKTAMLGKEIKKSPLMEKHLIGLGDQAMKEAADGLRNTSNQVELGRRLDRAYGKYSKFSPGARETITHQTPFIPWFLNMAKFNLSVMRKDHPVKASLLASYGAATEEWRKSQNLSYRGGGERVPDWMMGSYPTAAGNRRFGRFGPFVPGEYVGATGGQFTPMFQGILKNLSGADWTGKELKGRSQEQLAALAALTAAETFIPGVSQANRVTGFGKRYVQGKEDEPTIGKDKKIDKAVLDLLNPVKPIQSDGAGNSGGGVKVKPIKVRPIKVKPVKVKPVKVG